ncbi:MAG: DNA polymerase III subunit delta [Anaerolineae bacterium]|nr:DNA polymerase III subunit delta [Anaerolineae bacterium]
MTTKAAAPTFYVLHGEDEFSRRAAVQTMRDQMGDPTTADLNTAVFDGKNASVSDVLAAARAMPFLSDKRLVIVEGMLNWLSRKGAGKSGKAELETLRDGLSALPDSARVVFVEHGKLSARNIILKAAKEIRGGYHKEFNPPHNPQQWIMNRARDEYEAEIDRQGATALATLVAGNMRAADSELAKLVAYVNYERPITEADVAQMTAYVVEANVFEMVDAIGRRDGATAVWLMHRLLDNSEPLQLFGMIVRQFRLLILAREHLNQGGTPADTGQAIGAHPFVGKKVAEQARVFSQDQLERIYRFLLETDLSIKTGKVEAALALDLLIARVSS